MPRSKSLFLEICVEICSSMAESYPFSSELVPYGPSIAICSSLRHSSPYLIRFAPLRIHELNRTFAWCASVRIAMSGDMRANMQQHGRILPFFIRIVPYGPSIAISSSLRHSSPYLIRFARLRIHGLNRNWRRQAPSIAICSSPAGF